MSEISFEKDGSIRLLKYVDDIASELKSAGKYTNLALYKSVFGNTETGNFIAQNAVDGNNGMRWSTDANRQGILTVDLGREQDVNAIEIDFEFADKWHTFKVEFSFDNQHWQMLAGHVQQAIPAYEARFFKKDFKARYVRLSIVNSEDRSESFWNLKFGN